MRILAIDTALNACSLALVEDGALLGVSARAMSAGHAEHLAPMAAALFRETGIDPLTLGRIGVVVGPGQFAGVRIGLAFALGLAVGSEARVCGVSSLEALAESAGDFGSGAWDRPRAAVIDARRGDVYFALYEGPGASIIAPMVAPVDKAAEALAAAAGGRALYVCGSGAGLVAAGAPAGSIVDEGRIEIDPLAVARLVAAGDPSLRPPSPLYLRAPDAAPAKPSRFAALSP